MWLSITIVTVLFCMLWYRHRRNKDVVKLSKHLKTDIKEWPVLGHSYIFIGNNEVHMRAFQMLGQQAIKHGGLSYYWRLNRFSIVIADAEVANIVLKTCLEKDDIVRVFHLTVGNGTIFAPVNIWRQRRKVLLPTFSLKNLRCFVNVFSRQSSILVKRLQKSADKGPFSLWKYLTTFTFDSVCETTLGVQIKAQSQPNQPFLESFKEISEIVASRVCKPWLLNDDIFKMTQTYTKHEEHKKVLHDFIDKIIKLRHQSLNEAKNAEEIKHGNDDNRLKTFLQLIYESSGGDNGFSDLELREETLVIAMAGTDTSAVGSSFALLMLSRHPHVQEKVYAELRNVLGDSNRHIVADDLPHLKYLDAVVKESLRLYPPVPLISRKIEKPLTLPSGITLVPGTTAQVNIWALHRNPEYWGADADQFKPERFLEEELDHPAAWMPFSYGPRNCIGHQYAMLSMKTVLASLLRVYRVLPPNTNVHYNGVNEKIEPEKQPIRLKFTLMMRDVDEFMVQLETR